MNISGTNTATNPQLFQLPTQKRGGQIVQQAQSAPKQGASEESKETAVVQGKEAAQGTETKESQSIDLYA